MKQSEETKNYEPAIEGQVMILLDAFAYPELAQEGLMREVLNRVQRLRKRAGLVPTDDVKLAYAVLAPTGADGEVEKSGDEAAAAEGTRLENERVIEEMFAQRADAFAKAASKGVIKDDGSPAVLEEETDVKDVRLLLKLLKV